MQVETRNDPGMLRSLRSPQAAAVPLDDGSSPPTTPMKALYHPPVSPTTSSVTGATSSSSSGSISSSHDEDGGGSKSKFPNTHARNLAGLHKILSPLQTHKPKKLPEPEEEAIQVVFRMRPLNSEKEAAHGRSWAVLEEKASVIETNADGIPITAPGVSETNVRIVQGKNVFGHDKTFGEQASTRQVYNSVARPIVTSAIAPGLNGTIFAYGQTSSGKTYTMQGDGLDGDQPAAVTMPVHVEEPEDYNDESPSHDVDGESQTDNPQPDVAADTGGIVHMAARDIFEQIRHHPDHQDRVFKVRVSYIEIYNEEVRDLLVMSSENYNASAVAGDPQSAVLSVREDPNRGFFVPAKEQQVKTVEDMVELLVQGNRSRQFAATAMNKCSSRSHTIFRVVIESRERKKKPEPVVESNSEEVDSLDEAMSLAFNHFDDDHDDDHSEVTNEDDEINEESAIRTATLNFVDLAGSESVRHTGATGESLKEGCKINTSLSVLSRVIEALGTVDQPFRILPPFRESKLTRILQPSLSGNAKLVMICCGTPSTLYAEKTRSTLHFAARAKLVKTNARVNEILDDKTMIRRLQKELAAARRAMAKCDIKRVEAIESAFKNTVYKVHRLQDMLLESVFVSNEKDGYTPRPDSVDDSVLEGNFYYRFKKPSSLASLSTQALSLHLLQGQATSLPLTTSSDLFRIALAEQADHVQTLADQYDDLCADFDARDEEVEKLTMENTELQTKQQEQAKELEQLRAENFALKQQIAGVTPMVQPTIGKVEEKQEDYSHFEEDIEDPMMEERQATTNKPAEKENPYSHFEEDDIKDPMIQEREPTMSDNAQETNASAKKENPYSHFEEDDMEDPMMQEREVLTSQPAAEATPDCKISESDAPVAAEELPKLDDNEDYQQVEMEEERETEIQQDEEDDVDDAADTWWNLDDIHNENVPKRGAVPLLERCMVKYEWSEDFARRVLEAYKQFLTLQKEQDVDGQVFIPIGPVKLMWNEHFLDVDNYVNDCILLCGHVVKHNDLDEEDLNSDPHHLEAAFQRLGFVFEDELWIGRNSHNDEQPYEPVVAVVEEAKSDDSDDFQDCNEDPSNMNGDSASYQRSHMVFEDDDDAEAYF